VSETYDAAATGPDAGHESPGETDSVGYRETEAATEARIADQDQMPAPAESRPATWGDNPDYYDETDLGSEYDGDPSAFVAEQDELPPPQESHAATWGDNPDYYDETDLAAEYDGDLSALTTADHGPLATEEAGSSTGEQSPDDQRAGAEEHGNARGDRDDQDGMEPSPGDPAGHAQLAEPDARQEIAEETDLPNSGEAPETNQGATLDEARTSDDFTPEERAQLHAAYQDYLKEYGSAPTSGWEQGANVVGDKPDQSPGDTTDLPPTGEELLEMDNDKLSRFEKFRRETYKEIDDILDTSEQDSGTIEQLFDPPPTGGHAEVPVGHPVVDQPPSPGVDGGHFVVAGMVLAIAGVETVRAIRHTVDKWKGSHHAGDR
jgi:hypothetical protein